MKLPLLLLLLIFFESCAQDSKKSSQSNPFPAGYSLENRKEIPLQKELAEISGIAWYNSGFLAVEDESSAIYVLEHPSGNILSKMKFGKNEDIEDLLLADDTIWVLRSNGNLYRVSDFRKEGELEAVTYEFPIHEKRDMEAFVADITEPFLWIFCKVCEWDKGSDQTSIFRFDLTKMAFDPQPVREITKKQLSSFLSEKELKNLKIQPSAAAIHPITKEYYLLSSTGKWLMTLDNNMVPKSLHLLKSSIFPQPEGITFDPEGNLYISNEAAEGKSNILIFKYNP